MDGLIGGALGTGAATQPAATNQYFYQYQFVHVQTAGVANTITAGSANTITYGQQVYYPETVSYATNTVVWGNWNAAQQIQVDEQQLRELEEVRRAQEELQRRRVEEWQTASTRAAELLLMCLDEEQRLSWERARNFVVRCRSQNRYRLHYSGPPVRLGHDDAGDISYCIHTSGIPREDELLGFKLLLEANENLFLSTANATRLR